MVFGKKNLQNHNTGYFTPPNCLPVIGLSSKAVHVFNYFLAQAENFHPSIRLIAKKTTLSNNTVMYAVAELIEAGMLTTHPNPTIQGVKTTYRFEPIENWKILNESTDSTVSEFDTVLTERNSDCLNNLYCDVLKNYTEASQKLIHIKEETRRNKKNTKLDFEIIYKNYPRQQGRTKGIKLCHKLIKTEQQYKDLPIAINNYKSSCITNNTETKYIKTFPTFIMEWQDWLDPKTGKSNIKLAPTITALPNNNDEIDKSIRAVLGENK